MKLNAPQAAQRFSATAFRVSRDLRVGALAGEDAIKANSSRWDLEFDGRIQLGHGSAQIRCGFGSTAHKRYLPVVCKASRCEHYHKQQSSTGAQEVAFMSLSKTWRNPTPAMTLAAAARKLPTAGAVGRIFTQLPWANGAAARRRAVSDAGRGSHSHSHRHGAEAAASASPAGSGTVSAPLPGAVTASGAVDAAQAAADPSSHRVLFCSRCGAPTTHRVPQGALPWPLPLQCPAALGAWRAAGGPGQRAPTSLARVVPGSLLA